MCNILNALINMKYHKNQQNKKKNSPTMALGTYPETFFSFFGPRISAVGHDYKHEGPR